MLWSLFMSCVTGLDMTGCTIPQMLNAGPELHIHQSVSGRGGERTLSVSVSGQ